MCLLSVTEVRPGGAQEGTSSSVARWDLALFVPTADASPSHRGHGRCARSARTMCGVNGRASCMRRSAPGGALDSLLRAYLRPAARGLAADDDEGAMLFTACEPIPQLFRCEPMQSAE